MSDFALYVLLNPKTLTRSVSLEKGKGVQERWAVRGTFWNTESEFAGKPCSITFIRDNPPFLSDYAAKAGIESACGVLRHEANLVPETFESDGETVSLPPVEIILFQDGRGFEQAAELIASGASPGMSVNVAYSMPDRYILLAESVDLSQKQELCIVSFSFSSGMGGNDVVRAPQLRYDKATHHSFGFKVKSAHVEGTRHPSIVVWKITLYGDAQCQSLGLTVQDATLEIEEYERGAGNSYPESAFPGQVHVGRDDRFMWLDPTLRMTRAEMDSFATMIGSMSKGDVLTVHGAMITGEPVAAGDSKWLDVAYFGFRLVKSFAE